MKNRKIPSAQERRTLAIIPRRIPKTLAVVIATVIVGGSALLGIRASQRPQTQFADHNDDAVNNQIPEILNLPVPNLAVSSPAVVPVGRTANYETRSDIVPENGPGELAVAMPFLSFKNKAMEAEAVFKKETFNLMASDLISLQRKLPEQRGAKCRDEKYDVSLPTATVIIAFYNEPLSTLLRTVWSVINRSRPEHLLEVLLVDDASEREENKADLDNYVSSHFGTRVRILRQPAHKGLIQGKLAGARNATTEVLVFLDSHCEVNVGWLEPLLARIKTNRKLVACPMVDTIRAEDMSYTPSANWATGLFTWSLYYKWGPVGLTAAEKKRIGDADFEPHKTPTFPGGLFAMDRKWFFEVGSYDEQMEGWGGENLEMSFRVWMCGGVLEFIPCSRVGHISRTHTYNFADEDRNHQVNSARLAEVWMDDYKRHFYVARPAMKGAPIGNLSSRVAIRENLHCKSFKWFLENVFAEKFVPDEHSKKNGQIRNNGTHYCLHTNTPDEHSGSEFSIKPCITDSKRRDYLLQLFSLSVDDELRREEWCLDADSRVPTKLNPYVCDVNSHRHWTYTTNLQLRNSQTGKCLGARGDQADLQPCSDGPNQKWEFLPTQGL
ncbi:putative N-acetylgalactosaminyltransferase 9 [Hypsibius exemplaris]|uniref:Polypeptide N-acetylgalactosaminyltransferase n=1 Tax=Hypsibius exemplaris TaxID=2072580 RepID=A0A1W0WJ68_HYPEX|nr:putative N-acetylgalactosaminyltransferase 9 [Hypsibius exemplaris]